MGWLKKFFKGSSHRVSEGKGRCKYEDDRVSKESSSPTEYDRVSKGSSSLTEDDKVSKERSSSSEDDKVSNERSSPTDAPFEDEDEDLDHAMALSLSEEHSRAFSLAEEHDKGKEVDNGSRLEEDEQFARALQESWNVESPPHEDRHIFQPLSFLFPSRSRVCAGCKAEIGHGRYLSCMGAVWHPECFRCHFCNQPIEDYEFSRNGDHPYHKSCYRERHHPKCDVCREFIPTNMSGLIEYRAHPFWLQKYCPSHEHDGTPRCCCCERMEPIDTRYITLDDGRKLCLECLDSSIMDTHECQPLYLDIREFYEGLNMKVQQQIPLLLVERQALNEAMVGEKNGHHHLPETRGLCLSEEQIVSSILRRPRIGGNRIIEMITEPFRLVRQCEVTAILILYGLPRLMTGSILAHEMMHAWLRLNGFGSLPPDVEEGICQVLAHMWLDSEILSGSESNSEPVPSSSSASSSSAAGPVKKGTRSQFERKLGEFVKNQIESDSSEVYGEGFQRGNEAVLKYGLKRTLDHIRLTGSFPY